MSEQESTTVPHEWIPSTLGHGESMCKHCFVTNREAAVLGELNHCTVLASKTVGEEE